MVHVRVQFDIVLSFAILFRQEYYMQHIYKINGVSFLKPKQFYDFQVTESHTSCKKDHK